MLCVAATGVFYVLSGQHRLEAARTIRERTEAKRMTVPKWCTHFKCNILKANIPIQKVYCFACIHDACVSWLCEWH